MSLWKAVIADDEELMCDELKCLLEATGEISVAGVASTGREALGLIEKLDAEIVFLDIQMPGMNGMEVSRLLSSKANPPLIVFVTAFSNFAVDAFKVDAVDYILKPFDEGDIERVMKKLRERRRPAPARQPARFLKKILAEAGDRLEVIDVARIQYFQAEERQVFLFTTEGKRYEIKNRLNELEEMLDPDEFFRCHRNYLVNVNHISQLANWFHRGYLLIMKSPPAEIPVGRVYAPRLKQYLPI